jgi:hypothetical protein
MNSFCDTKYHVALFPSVNYVMKAEKFLLSENLPIKIIPVPKILSSDCGVCIRFTMEMSGKIKKILDQNFEGVEYRQL